MEDEVLSGFVITPLKAVYSERRNTINEALEGLGVNAISVVDVDATAEARPTATSARDAIEKADFIIADITEGQPSVMYEVGLAHALRKPTLLITERGQFRLPRALDGFIFLGYEPNNLSLLSKHIISWIRSYMGLK